MLKEERADHLRYLQTLDALIEEEQQLSFAAERELQTEVAVLLGEKERLAGEVESISRSIEGQASSREALRLRAAAMEAKEEQFWTEHNKYQLQQREYQEQVETLSAGIAYADAQLSRRINVADEVFHIWRDGEFGTINTFRWGRLPSHPVDWNEINAAWGEAAELLYAIAGRFGVEHGRFRRFRLLPCGCASKIQVIETGEFFELFGSSDLSFGRSPWYQRFDFAMTCFLRCLRELGTIVRHRDPSFPDFRISDDGESIGQLSIRMTSNTDENWTKALMYLLQNLKFLLAWATRRPT